MLYKHSSDTLELISICYTHTDTDKMRWMVDWKFFFHHNKGTLQKIKPLFCDKCHKRGGGQETHLSQKNNHVSQSFSGHLEHL